MYDLIIIGGSAAGCSAAVYAARRRLNFKMVTLDVGGEIAVSGEIENWPGVNHTDGIALAEQFKKQLEYNKVPIDEGFMVTTLEQKEKAWVVSAIDPNEKPVMYETKTVLITTGVKPKKLNAPGEDALYQKGVTYCTVCDGPLFKGKTTATIGGGNSALESGLMMATIASKVYVINKNPQFKGEQILIEKLKAEPNVEIIYNALTQKIVGNGFVSGVEYKDALLGEVKKIDVQGVMIHIGNKPNSEWVTCVEKNKFGNIVIDRFGKTNCPGVYAAGDVTDIPYQQIVIAAGQGVTAVLAAIDYINRWSV